MNTDTETTNTQETASSHGEGENKSKDDPKRVLAEKIWDSIKAPEIKESHGSFEASFAVCRPGDNSEVLCYCTGEEDAKAIASAIGLATKMAIARVVLM